MLPYPATKHVFYGTVPLLIAAIAGIWNNNQRLNDFGKRIDDLRSHMDSGFVNLRSEMGHGFSDVRDWLSKLEDRVKDLGNGL